MWNCPIKILLCGRIMSLGDLLVYLRSILSATSTESLIKKNILKYTIMSRDKMLMDHLPP